MPLREMRRPFPDGSSRPLMKCAQYQYLKTRDEQIYLDFLDWLKKLGVMEKGSQTWSMERFKALEKKINKEGYCPEKSAIVVNQDNYVCDGLHRASILLYKYGPEHKIPVIRVSRR